MANPPAKKSGLTTDEKVEAIIDLLALNGVTIPEKLRPAKDK